MAKKAQTANNNYFNIVVTEKNKPYFGVYYDTEKEGLTKIESFDNEGKTKGIKFYDLYSEIEGKIKSVGIYDKDTKAGGKYEVLTVSIETEDKQTEVISVSFQSQFAQSFIKVIENVDPEKTVQLKVFRIKDETKTIAKGVDCFRDYFCVYQLNGTTGKMETVKSKYNFISDTNDQDLNVNPNQLPEFEKKQVKEKGKTVTKYDTSNFDEALRDIIKNINPEFKKAYDWSTKVDNTLEEKQQQSVDNDDLPF